MPSLLLKEIFSKIFKINKKPLKDKVKAVLLYFSELSLRNAGKHTNVRHENVRKLFRKTEISLV